MKLIGKPRLMLPHKFKKGDTIIDFNGQKAFINGPAYSDGYTAYWLKSIPKDKIFWVTPSIEKYLRLHRMVLTEIKFFDEEG